MSKQRALTRKDGPRADCYDCGLPYVEFPCDMLIQDELWERIRPSIHEGGGLLCPNCMCARMMTLGMTRVLVVVDTAELLPTWEQLTAAPSAASPDGPPIRFLKGGL